MRQISPRPLIWYIFRPKRSDSRLISVCSKLGVDMGVDMRMGMSVDMNVDMGMDMGVDMSVDMGIDFPLGGIAPMMLGSFFYS